ncbi:hypothetical protein FRB95_003629, partial [Tulasnella sp. JGI-2019a]
HHQHLYLVHHPHHKRSLIWVSMSSFIKVAELKHYLTLGKLPALDTGDVMPTEPPSPSVSGMSSTFTTSASNLGLHLSPKLNLTAFLTFQECQPSSSPVSCSMCPQWSICLPLQHFQVPTQTPLPSSLATSKWWDCFGMGSSPPVEALMPTPAHVLTPSSGLLAVGIASPASSSHSPLVHHSHCHHLLLEVANCVPIPSSWHWIQH